MYLLQITSTRWHEDTERFVQRIEVAMKVLSPWKTLSASVRLKYDIDQDAGNLQAMH